MCLEIGACLCIFTSFTRCFLCVPLTTGVTLLPLLDLMEFLSSVTFITCVVLFQDTFFGHVVILLPAIALSALIKLVGVIPLLVFSTQSTTTMDRKALSPYVIYTVIRFTALTFCLVSFLLQMAFSIYAI